MNSLDLALVPNLRLFDANCRLGSSELTACSSPATVAGLVAEMDRCGITEALTYHAAAEGYSPAYGNARLLDEIGREPRLHAVWVAMPQQIDEAGDGRLWARQMLATGVRAARMFPSRHRFSLSGWSVNNLLGELNEYHLPLFLDFERRHWLDNVVDYDAVHRIGVDFPRLPLVLVREGIGSTRFLYPLFERLENLYIEISYYQAPGGLADIAKRFGTRRLLFGTGLPVYAAGPAVSMLLGSELSWQEKEMVAGANLRALLQQVARTQARSRTLQQES